MYFSLEQIEASIKRLHSVHPFFGIAYLAFKLERLPVGEQTKVVFSNVMEFMLQTYYRPSMRYAGFYSPFHTSNRESRWPNDRYGSTTLQRICADTFAEAFLHTKGTSEWGWSRNYVKVLKKKLGSTRLPAFDLAVWLFRDYEWPNEFQPDHVVYVFFETFLITEEEQSVLFDRQLGVHYKDWQAEDPAGVSEAIFEVIGHPPGEKPVGAILHRLAMESVGPSRELEYEPSSRLNLVTGDNSLGKTFLLDIVWWALTQDWDGYSAQPQEKSARPARIDFRVGRSSRATECNARFNLSMQNWDVQKKGQQSLPGLVIYARHNGSFSIWDVYRSFIPTSGAGFGDPSSVKLTPSEVWHGLMSSGPSQLTPICNGLLRDWLMWQSTDRFSEQFKAFSACLKHLSSDIENPLVPGKPVRKLAFGAQEVPTLRFPYGDVPLPLASAGVQRVVALAYILVWSWFEHLELTTIALLKPHRQIILIIDEVEAHLHPRWQRAIVPALMSVVEKLAPQVATQIHIATHSPMVLASVEPYFNDEKDSLFHLQLERTKGQQDVKLISVPFNRRGTADRWLMDPVIGLEQARSVEAENAIENAVKLQRQKKPDAGEVKNVHLALQRCLADDDAFWPRWLFFASQFGVNP